MYEGYTFDYLMSRMLDRVPSDVDKREGSIIWDALAPAAAELALLYRELDINQNLAFADTATGEYLERRTAEFGIHRSPATHARRKGLFFNSAGAPIDIPQQSRFSIANINYTAIEKLSTGVYILECEMAGSLGNQHFGSLLPLDYVPDLARCEIADVIAPGEDAESDEDLRTRYYAGINEQPFGGNVSDYRNKINSIPGVGGVKVFPAWKGGGTVKATIIAADWGIPAAELVDSVQTIVDPTVNSGKGLGTAPIGHQVTITSVVDKWIWADVKVVLDKGITTGQVKAAIEETFEGYFRDLRKEWENQDAIVVRVAQITARLLLIPGIKDVEKVMLESQMSNIILGADEVPLLSGVAVYE
ncbi:MAG: baseplate J/gp47 family protein [Paenibacillus dendritiformis]|uniref:baseplate J/gp47 family protein n=1 Tax=uncultured Paenibacillus sp. TaxID=227322 RepID=UPI0025F9502B|nr:baseplate J/gp47 family protein [uncultured Paenibacillus sp.]MDU5141054.1 baseplate J/gp47 family protein [Paenibacillus dendritiformis]